MSRRKRLPEGSFNISIDSLTHEGRGLATLEDGKKLFVHGGLPGEDVTFEYTFVNKSRAEGRMVSVQNPSPLREVPACEAYERCGGCSLQHMDHKAQLAHKQAYVLELFSHWATLTPNQILPPMVGPQWGYRKKARLGVRYVPKKGGVLVGFREKFSNRIALMDECLVLDARVGQLIEPLKTVLNDLSIRDQIAQIEVAMTEHETALVVRHLAPFTQEDLTRFSAFCQKFNLLFYAQPKGVDSVHRVYPEGPLYLSYTLADQNLHFDFHPLDFTQVNAQINQAMINAALERLDIQPEDRVLDLFCGIGNFTLPLAQKAKHVIGVEGAVGAIDRARHNAKHNGLENVGFYVNNLFETPFDESWSNQSYDKVLLDPPRSGAQALMPWLADKSPQKILYVSCNPATMARDAQNLAQMGYTLESLQIMDMFPHTSHVETMGLFEKG